MLADFIVECTVPEERSTQQKSEQITTNSAWILHVDGASNLQGYGAGFILSNSKGVITKYALYFSFKISNNQAKYEALITKVKMAK